jgi:hypothetical protein
MGKAERVTTVRHCVDGCSREGNRKQSCGEFRQHISPPSFAYIYGPPYGHLLGKHRAYARYLMSG